MVKISYNSFAEISKSLKKAIGLDTFPLAIYGSANKPDNAVSMCSIDRCVARSMLVNAIDKDEPAHYIGKDNLKGCCPGAMTYMGFKEPLKFIKYFVSTGNPRFRGGEAEYLKASPELVEEFLNSIGKIKTPDNYIVIEKCENIDDDVDVRSILCFGNGEQIRNLCSLIHFRTNNPFNAINVPFGPACATFVTYPAGMAEKSPRNSAFVGPVDPTGNIWFPPEYMAIGIPIDIAIKMHEDIDNSFATKRPEVANPHKRDKL